MAWPARCGQISVLGPEILHLSGHENHDEPMHVFLNWGYPVSAGSPKSNNLAIILLV